MSISVIVTGIINITTTTITITTTTTTTTTITTTTMTTIVTTAWSRHRATHIYNSKTSACYNKYKRCRHNQDNTKTNK